MITCRAPLLALLAALFLSACQSPSASGPNSSSQRIAEPKADDPSVDWTDPCAVNLGHIVENILLFYSKNHRLPNTLAELPQKSIDGDPISLNCPASGKPYLYYPQGYSPPLDLMPSGVRLILYDAVPGHVRILHLNDGHRDIDVKQNVRLGVVMVPKTTRTQGDWATSAGGLQLIPVPIEQNLLDLYLKSSQRIQILPIPSNQ